MCLLYLLTMLVVMQILNLRKIKNLLENQKT